MSDSIRVLIVNDEPEVVNLWSMMVKRQADMEVVGTASDGREAVTMAQALQPDVIMMDYMMPGMDGLTATEQIRQTLPQVRVIVYSAHPEAEERALRAGAVAGVKMPQPPQNMIQTVRDAMKK